MAELLYDGSVYELEQFSFESAVDSMEDTDADDADRMRRAQLAMQGDQIDDTFIEFVEQPHGTERDVLIESEYADLWMNVTRTVWNYEEQKDHRQPPQEDGETPINSVITFSVVGPYEESDVEAV